MQTLHVTNKVFSLDQLDSVLEKCLPGCYKIVWHTKKDIYDIMLYWDGQRYRDLYKEELYN